jgi:hypothetical protein
MSSGQGEPKQQQKLESIPGLKFLTTFAQNESAGAIRPIRLRVEGLLIHFQFKFI